MLTVKAATWLWVWVLKRTCGAVHAPLAGPRIKLLSWHVTGSIYLLRKKGVGETNRDPRAIYDAEKRAARSSISGVQSQWSNARIMVNFANYMIERESNEQS